MALITYSERVVAMPEFLSAAECAELITLAELQGFSAAGVRLPEGETLLPNARNNQRASIVSPDWVATLWQRLAAFSLPELAGEVPRGLPRTLRFYKYTAGQRFRMHKDGPWHEDGLSSRVTLLVYLNDGFAGGETDFRDFRVQPRTGSALCFFHDTWHEGAAVSAGVKYALRSDVLYGPRP